MLGFKGGSVFMAQTKTDTIKVEPYDDAAWVGSWKQRASGLWAAGGVGLLFGAAIGLVAPFFPVVVGAYSAATAVGMIGTSVATFASLGVVSGAVAGGMVGASSGGAAAAAAEQERREKSRELKTGIDFPAPDKVVEPEPKGIGAKLASYVNVRSGLIFTALGMVVGGVFAAAAILPGSAVGLTGAIANVGMGSIVAAGTATGHAALAAAAYCVGVMGSFGALFGFRFAHMTNDARKVTATWLSTKFSDEKAVEGQALQLAQEQNKQLEGAVVDVQAEQVGAGARSHAEKHASRTGQSFQELVLNRSSESASLQLTTR